MTVTKKQIEDVLNILPIGYYAKRKINLKLDESSNASYYNPMNDEIVISYSQLEQTIDSLDEIDLENDIRCMLYHEISHAILTPKNLEVTTYINIIEDERIETILSNYYMRVNFREFVKKVNHYKGEAPKNADEAFYHLIRFRKGTDYWLNRLKELIDKYKELSRKDYWDRDGVYDYKVDCKSFYTEFINDYFENQAKQNKIPETQEENKEENQTQTQEQNNQTKSNQETQEQPQTKQETQKEQQTTDGEDFEQEKEIETSIPAHGHGENPEYDEAFANEIVANTFNKLNNKKLIDKLTTILNRINKNNNKNGSAINSYSGRFDIRSVNRDDCKYFVAQNRNGHVKQYSKTNLNLFVDASGSFCSSEKKANELIYALIQFEKTNPDFNLNVITMNQKIKILNKNERTLKCNGGNYLTPNLENIYKSLQAKDATNYNIALWDGDANSDCRRELKAEANKRFGVFNHDNCVIISDPDNEKPIRKYCKSAKIIITTNYTELLEENVFKTLQSLTR